MKAKICFVIGVFLCPHFLFSQDYAVNTSDSDTITGKLRVALGYKCAIESIVNFDWVKKPMDRDEGGFEDPYGNLQHCFVFTYYRDTAGTEEYPKLSVGIFKAGRIISRLDTAIETLPQPAVASRQWLI